MCLPVPSAKKNGETTDLLDALAAFVSPQTTHRWIDPVSAATGPAFSKVLRSNGSSLEGEAIWERNKHAIHIG